MPPSAPIVSPEKIYEPFVVDRPGRIILVEHHLSTRQSLPCQIRRMSVQGATLEVAAGAVVPAHFFLEIFGIRDEIGCTLVSRAQDRLTVGFNMLIDADFLHHVIRLGFDAAPS
ncbi:hypothetical protein ACQKKX_13285 [Neorhizobium sp. NPDC001467]|uniref:hypothetical protein n=1 Tax=Neorhizobium sp. NPDC001467 TaxID=3390595 RepID=UPI003D0452DC